MQRVQKKEAPTEGMELHRKLERAWVQTGILSSEKERIHMDRMVQELGAVLDGDRETIEGSALRILELIQSTLVVIAKPKLKEKWVKVLTGRWARLFSFRHPAMVMRRPPVVL